MNTSITSKINIENSLEQMGRSRKKILNKIAHGIMKEVEKQIGRASCRERVLMPV